MKKEAFPILEYDEDKNAKVALAGAYVGAPGAAVQIEVLTALGCRKYIACGGCGILQKDIAVSQYNKVEFGQILYAGDNLSGTEWDRRGWDSQAAIRENVLRIALDACVAM